MSEVVKQRMFGMVDEYDGTKKERENLLASLRLLRRDLKKLMASAKDLAPEQAAQYHAMRKQQTECGTQLTAINRKRRELVDSLCELIRDYRLEGSCSKEQ